MMQQHTCRYCEAPILCAATLSNTHVAFDEEPHDKGRWIVVDDIARRRSKDELDGPALIPHEATCPRRYEWTQGPPCGY